MRDPKRKEKRNLKRSIPPPASPPPDKNKVSPKKDNKPNPAGNRDNQPEEQAAG
jgi:hypothetical protein